MKDAATGTALRRDWRALSAAAYRSFPWKRAVLAVCLTFFAHGAIYYAAPQTLVAFSRTLVPAEPVELLHEKELEEIPEDLLPEEFRAKPQFVPANPEAPSATPPETQNFSSADSRAAQEDPEPGSRSRTPTREGELEDSRAISETVLPRELIPPEATPFVPAKKKETLSKKSEVSAGEKLDTNGVDLPLDDDSAGTLEQGEAPAERSEETETADLPDPAPRPQIAPPAGLKMITMRSNTATNEIGSCSLDAKYSEYGDYTQRMLEAIQAAWYLTVWRTAIVQPAAVVVIEFTLHSNGEIIDAHVVYSNASQPATYACLDAVCSRAPFDPWRADMQAFIGKDSETTRISFYYR